MDKLISANAVRKVLGCFTDTKHGNPHFLNGIATAVEIIENAEEAVVRCKECKHGKWNQSLIDDITCSYWEADKNREDYCSMGERREDDIC